MLHELPMYVPWVSHSFFLDSLEARAAFLIFPHCPQDDLLPSSPIWAVDLSARHQRGTGGAGLPRPQVRPTWLIYIGHIYTHILLSYPVTLVAHNNYTLKESFVIDASSVGLVQVFAEFVL